jgi:hypothetical protein
VVASVFYYLLIYFKKAVTTNHAYSALVLAGIYWIGYGIAAEIHLALLRAFAMESTGGVWTRSR